MGWDELGDVGRNLGVDHQEIRLGDRARYQAVRYLVDVNCKRTVCRRIRRGVKSPWPRPTIPGVPWMLGHTTLDPKKFHTSISSGAQSWPRREGLIVD